MNNTTFQNELTALLNVHSQETPSDTPDWILAQYLLAQLAAFNNAVQQRENWYGRNHQEAAAEIERLETENRGLLREALEYPVYKTLTRERDAAERLLREALRENALEGGLNFALTQRIHIHLASHTEGET